MIPALIRYLQLAAAYVAATVLSGLAIAAVLSVKPGLEFDVPFVPLAGFSMIVIGLWAAVPAHGFVALMEWRAIRTVWAYCGFASLAGLAFSFILRGPFWMPLAGIAIGIATGFLFWFIAGRSAGRLNGQGRSGGQLLGLLGLSATVIAGLTAAYAF